MIIVVAALEFADQADRDHAVEITKDVQMATRVEEAGVSGLLFRSRPFSTDKDSGLRAMG